MVQASILSASENDLARTPAPQGHGTARAQGGETESSASVLDLFVQVVRANLAAPAVTDANGSATYAQLWNHAAEFASRLTDGGVKPGDMVGIAAGRSLGTVAAILGVVFAGGCYVPVDFNDFAPDFSDHLVQQHSIHHWIADAHARQQYSKRLSGCHVLDLENVSCPANPRLVEISSVTVCGSSPIYVMFTSGSTGLPKGVVVPHRAVARLVTNQNFIEFGPQQTFLLHSPLSFDASTLEFWGGLLHGGTVAVAPAGRLSLDDYARILRDSSVTTLWLTAAMFHLAAEHAPEMFASLKQLVFGGDVISPSHVAKIRGMYPDLRMVNGYGPTENTTFTCCYAVPRKYCVEGTLPIGSPIAHTTAYILDAALLPVPDGQEGELVTGGDGVALGYLNQPEATAEKFVLDPFAAVPEARMYRTGDRVRRRADGAIEFLGRIDRQVKIAGHRVEVAAVESAIAESPLVTEAAVTVLTPGSGEKQLAVCVVLRNPTAGAEKLLREHLEARFSHASVPQQWLVLEKLPINANGKIDRTAVQTMCKTRFLARAGESPSQDALPKAWDSSSCADFLRQLWIELLGRESVGDEENFFDIGGTSLLLIEMHARLRGRFSSMPSLVEMFDFPTIRALASRLSVTQNTSGPQNAAAERGQRQRTAMLARRKNLSALKDDAAISSALADAGRGHSQ